MGGMSGSGTPPWAEPLELEAAVPLLEVLDCFLWPPPGRRAWVKACRKDLLDAA